MTVTEKTELALDVLLSETMSDADAADAGSELFDERRRLLAIIRQCVATNDATTLEKLCYGTVAAHQILHHSTPRTRRMEALTSPPFKPTDNALVHAARALAGLGLALVVGPSTAGPHLHVFRQWISHSGLDASSKAVSDIPAAISTKHDTTIRALIDRGEVDLLTLVWILELEAWLHPDGDTRKRTKKDLRAWLRRSGGTRKPTKKGPSALVLFDRGNSGQRAVLTMSRLPGLPRGLVPNPATMTLSSADSRFQHALHTAWRAAGRGTRGTTLWSLADRGGPIIRVTDKSLGLAFTVLLDETRRVGRRFLKLVTVGRLRPRTAIVGHVDPEGLKATAPVSGYGAKFQAIDEQTRVVLPRANESEAKEANTRYGDNAELVPVATWRKAARASRRVDRRRLLTISVVGLLAIAMGTFGLYRIAESQRSDEERRAAAVDLAATAITLRETDPSLSAKLALAAHRIDSTNDKAVNAMRDVLQSNRNVVRTWQADPSQVDSLAVSSAHKRVLSSGTEDVIKVWDLETGRLVERLPRYAYRLVTAQDQALAAAATHDGVALYDIAGDQPGDLGLLPTASCTSNDSVVTLDFTHNDTAVVVVWEDGSVSLYDVVTHEETLCQQPQDTLAPLPSVDSLPTRKVIAADIVAATDTNSSDEVLILLSDNRVVSSQLGQRQARVEVSADELAGDATLVAAEPNILAVATPQGVAVWRRHDHTLLANPAGGIGAAPRVLADAHGHILISGDTGTALVPIAIDGWTMDDSLATLNGGAATVAAISQRDLVAGGPAGRVSVLADSSGELALAQDTRATAMTFTDDGQVLAAEVRNGARGTNASNLVLVDPKRPPAESPDEPTPFPRWTYGDDQPVTFYANAVATTRGLVAAAGLTYGQGTVLVWRTSNHTTPTPLTLQPKDNDNLKPEQRIIAGVDFTADGKLLIARSVSGQVGIWSTQDWRQLGTLNLKAGNPRMLVRGNLGIFTEGEPEVAEIVEFDLKTRKELHRIKAPGALRLAANKDATRLVSMTLYGEVQQRQADLTAVGDPWRVPNYANQFGEIAMNQRGTQLAVPRGDELLVYDLDDQTLAMPPFEADGDIIIDVAWSPDDRLLAASPLPPERGYKDATYLRVWKTGGQDWTNQVCRWAGGGLTHSEWSRYVDDSIPFTNLCAEVRP
jgi:WD40 repeat protein